MKKKLLALLLASSMALMNVAPAYGTDIFTDPDNVANEDFLSHLYNRKYIQDLPSSSCKIRC